MTKINTHINYDERYIRNNRINNDVVKPVDYNELNDIVMKLVKNNNDAEYKALLPIGFVYFSISKQIAAGSLPCLGAEYSRSVYPDLWAEVQSKGLVISESQWQSKFRANNGNVPYYSNGDGYSTFRVPSLKCWVKGAGEIREVGSYLEAGLPNIEGEFGATITAGGSDFGTITAPFERTGGTYNSNVKSAGGDNWGSQIGFDASRSNAIYGKSNTVQPESIVGVYCVVAVGEVTNIGSADVSQIAGDYERVNTKLSELYNGVGKAKRYITETYQSGTEWYEKFNDGWLRQGGMIPKLPTVVSFLIPFANANYTVLGLPREETGSYENLTVETITRTSMKLRLANRGELQYKAYWVAEGQGL